MFLHKRGKKIVALLLAMAIVLSGVTIIGNPAVKKDFVRFGSEVQGVSCAWKQKANAPFSSENHVAVAINNKMYVFGGQFRLNNTGYVSNALWEYNPVTDTWVQKSRYSNAYDAQYASVIDGKMYIIFQKKICIYDPSTDLWETKNVDVVDDAFFGEISVATVNNKLYIYHGWRSSGELYEYDPATGLCIRKASNQTDYYTGQKYITSSAVEINGKLYIYNTWNGIDFGGLAEYDPMTNTWTQKSSYSCRGDFTAVNVNGKMYVYGFNPLNGFNGMAEYDPATNVWTQQADSSIERKNHSAVSINGKMYVFGGMQDPDSLWECTITNAPILTVSTPTHDQNFSEADTTFVPQINVSDKDNEALTCKYYMDSETTARETKIVTNTVTTQQVSFNPIDMNILGEGIHKIRYEVTDGLVAEPVTQTITFKVDKSAPTLGEITSSSTTDTITINGSATDGISGLAAEPYRYTIGSEVSSWLDSQTYTSQNNLTPNTQYSTKFEARDAKGHILTSLQNVYTKADVPDLAVNNASSYTLDVSTSDNNSDSTQYQISVNNSSQYVTQEGTLTAAPAWITLTNKNVTVTGLSPEQTYTFTAKARNAENIETVAGSSVSGTTLIAPPGSPANIIATATDKTITVSWDASSGAIGYEIEVDGTVVNTDTATRYTHVGINPGTPHTYRVRARNAGGPGNWSAPITKSTLPASPDIPVNLNAVPLSTSVTVTWNNVSGATGYDIEVDGALVDNGPNTNYIHNSLTPGTHHTYRVRSINPGGKSEWSGYVNTTTLLDTVPVPINISATPALNSIILTWDKVSGASGYEISVDGVAFDNGTRTTYTHSNLAPGTQHVYRVRAKKSGVSSEWSAAVVSATLTNEFGTPSNLKANADNSSIVLSWNPVANATGYEVEVDGVATDNGDETTCIHNGLLPNTPHTYRVRAKRDTEVSEWTEPLAVNTFLLQTPKELTANSDETSMTINWQPIEGATSYELDFDGSVITGISETTYSAGGLEQNSQHEIKVRAVSEGGNSNWSTVLIKSTKFTSGNVPKVSAIAKKTSISVMWNKIDGATSYDVEADGAVTSNVNALTYTSKGLLAGTKHTYRVRANNSSGAGDWGSVFTVSTLPQGPVIPSNVVSSSNMTSILISWDKVAGAEEYEIEVDGLIIDNGTGTSYLHKGLSPDTTHNYKVRARSVSGISEWSTPMIIKTLNSVQTYDITSSAGEEFDLILSGSDIQDLNKYTFSIQYDTKDFDLIDLCGFTPKTDTQEGDVYGTDITVKQVAPGTIVFVKKGSAQSWQVWSGIVNSIRLRAKHDGLAEITYTIQ